MNMAIDSATPVDQRVRLYRLLQTVLAVRHVTPLEPGGFAYRGHLTVSPEEALDRLDPELARQGLVGLLRREAEEDVVAVVPRPASAKTPNPWINAGLFAATFLAVAYAGLVTASAYLTSDITGVSPSLTSPAVLLLGAAFTASFLGILLAHEFGHYFAARFHRTRVSLPYFIPFPGSLLGTLGAAIRILEPPRNRRVLLDIGMAGPLAGLVVAIPLLLIGLSQSHISPLPSTAAGFAGVSLEGNSILYLAAKALVTGHWLPAPASYGNVVPLVYWARFILLGQPAPIGGTDVFLHPVAWAGWAGLMVTAFNLIPAGQLDGGHAIYGLFGRGARAFLPFVVGGLVLLGFVWSGWWLWAVLVLLLGRYQAQVLDEITPLDARRRWVAVLGLVLFFLLFIPVPFQVFG
jgi:membrane-associated protease RseP (regulator of RpoE activity)